MKRNVDEISVFNPLEGFEMPDLEPDTEYTRLFVNKGAVIPDLFFKYYKVETIIRNCPWYITKKWKRNNGGIVLMKNDLRLFTDGTMRVAFIHKKKTQWNPFEILGTSYYYSLDLDVKVDGKLYEAGSVLYDGETVCWQARECRRASAYKKWVETDKPKGTTKLFEFVRDKLGGNWDLFKTTKTTMDKRHIKTAERFVTTKYDCPLNDQDGGKGEYFGGIGYNKTKNTFMAYYGHNGEHSWSSTDKSIEIVYKWLEDRYQECLEENYEKYIKRPMKPLQMYKNHLSNKYGIIFE